LTLNQTNLTSIQDALGTLVYRFSLTLLDGDKTVVIDDTKLVSKFYCKCTDGLDSASRQTIFTYASEYGEITLVCAYDKDETKRFRLQLSFKNGTDRNLKLMKLTPFIVEGENSLSLCGVPAAEWRLYRQGRHKNDMPSVCVLGVKDGSYKDAQAGLTETGGGMKDTSTPNRFLSDQLTVLTTGAASLTMAFLTGADQMVETTLSMTPDDHFSALASSSLPECTIKPGQTISSEWLRIDRQPDALAAMNEFAADKAKIYNVKRNPKTPSVFCTWYYYGLSVTYDDVLSDLGELERRKIPFDVFQIDEGWEITLGDWRRNHKFPVPLDEVASIIQKAGFTPGIWTSPFIAHATAPICEEHPEWLLRKKNGELCLFPMNSTVYNVLDITNPAVVEWVYQLYATLREWGYTYHKLDFTRAPVIQSDAVFFDDTISIAAAYRRAIQAVRDGSGEDAYVLICGGLYDPVLGLVDAQRTGSDVMSMWSEHRGQDGGRTAPYTIKQSLLRYWMNDWWQNDPDALMIRRQDEPFRGLALGYGLLSDTEAITSTMNQYIGGGIVCSTEPMKKIEDDRLMLMRHIIPTVPTRVMPRDLFSGNRYPSVVDVSVSEKNWHTVALINWADDTEMSASITLDHTLVGDFAQEDKTYTLCEFFSGQVVEDVRYGDTVTFGSIPVHGCALIKVMVQNPNWPQIVKSTGHFSFGGEVDCYLCKHNKLVFDVDWKFPCPVSYTVRLPKWYQVPALPENIAYQPEGHCLIIDLPGADHYRFVL